VLLGVLAVVLTCLAVSGYAAVTALHGYLLSQTDNDLRAVASEYQPQAGGTGTSQPRIAVPLSLPPILDRYYIALASGRGQTSVIVEGNRRLVPQIPANLAGLATGDAQTVPSADGRTQLRMLVEAIGGRTLIVATSLDNLSQTVSHIQLIIIMASLGTTLVLVAGVSLVVRRGLRPIEAMADAADRITAGDLTSRVSPDDPATEVGRLGMALNGMLTRIETAVADKEAAQRVTRQFFADASHELRTPLASLRANAELYLQGALPLRPQVDEAMRRITAEAQRMTTLVDDMLRLARLDLQPGQRHEHVDLSALATDCLKRTRTAYRGHAWHSRVAPGLSATGDEEMLRRAIDNLLANVATHTPEGTTATLTASTAGRIIAIEVSDDGPGVPASDLPRIFDRFYRARAQAHRPGSGLGLAIVAGIAAAHHGTAEARLNSPHGLHVTLALPATSEPAHGDPQLPRQPMPGTP
jgi:two-component system OmpR family sensor kinase